MPPGHGASILTWCQRVPSEVPRHPGREPPCGGGIRDAPNRPHPAGSGQGEIVMSEAAPRSSRHLARTALVIAGAVAVIAAAILACFPTVRERIVVAYHDAVVMLAPATAERMILERVERRAAAAEAIVGEALALPASDAVEALRRLVRTHVTNNPPFEGDEGWPVRIRAIRALATLAPAIQRAALPELAHTLAWDCGTAIDDARAILVRMDCEALPAAPRLIGVLQSGDPGRSERALSVLAHLAVTCGDRFNERDAAVQAMLESLRDSRSGRSIRGAVLAELPAFDPTGARCAEAVRQLADDPGASTDLREQAAAVLVQLGLNR